MILILIAVATAIPLYLLMNGYVGSVKSPPSPELLVIEEVYPRTGEGKVYGLNVVIANHGPDPVVVGNASALIISGDGKVYETTLVLTEYPLKIPAGGVGEVILYPKEEVPPGRYYVRLSIQGGVAVATLTLNKPILGSKVALLTTSNTASNPVVLQDANCVYEAWVEYNSATGLYKVWFSFTPKPGVTLTFVRAELLSAENNYPVWVGGNPYVSTSPPATPLYWTPVKPEEFPVKVVFTSSR